MLSSQDRPQTESVKINHNTTMEKKKRQNEKEFLNYVEEIFVKMLVMPPAATGRR